MRSEFEEVLGRRGLRNGEGGGGGILGLGGGNGERGSRARDDASGGEREVKDERKDTNVDC